MQSGGQRAGASAPARAPGKPLKRRAQQQFAAPGPPFSPGAGGKPAARRRCGASGWRRGWPWGPGLPQRAMGPRDGRAPKTSRNCERNAPRSWCMMVSCSPPKRRAGRGRADRKRRGKAHGMAAPAPRQRTPWSPPAPPAGGHPSPWLFTRPQRGAAAPPKRPGARHRAAPCGLDMPRRRGERRAAGTTWGAGLGTGGCGRLGEGRLLPFLVMASSLASGKALLSSHQAWRFDLCALSDGWPVCSGPMPSAPGPTPHGDHECREG